MVYVVLFYDMGWGVDCVFAREIDAMNYVDQQKAEDPDWIFSIKGYKVR